MALTTSAGDKPFGLEQIRPDIDHDLALLSAVRIRNRRALHGRERGADQMLRAKSNSCCSLSPLPESASCRMGTLEAL